MKILKMGTVPGERLHVTKCSRCTTEFEFAEKEAIPHSDRDGAYFSVECPLKGCNNTVYYHPKKNTTNY